MREIASIIHRVLASTTPGVTKDGKKSKAQYVLAQAARDEASARVRDVLVKYPVYPEVDLRFLREHFSVEQ